MAKKKYTPEATVDLLYNKLMNDYKGDAQAEAERQKQRRAEGKTNEYTYTNAKSGNSSASTGNSLKSSSAVSKGASAVGNMFKSSGRKYTATTGTKKSGDDKFTTKGTYGKSSGSESGTRSSGRGRTRDLEASKYGADNARGDSRGITPSRSTSYRDKTGIDLKSGKENEADRIARNVLGRMGRTAGGATQQFVGGHMSSVGTTLQELETTANTYDKARYQGEEARRTKTKEQYESGAQGYRGSLKQGIDTRNAERNYDIDPNALSHGIIKKGDELIGKGSEKIESAKEGAGKVGSLALDLEANALQMLGDRTLAFVPVVGQALAMGSLMNRAGGTASYEARQEGMNADQQFMYQQGTALIEGLSEGIFNSVSAFQSTYGKGMFSLADKVSTRVASSNIVANVFKTEAGRTFAYNLARLGAEMFEEGFEEVVADILEPALKYTLMRASDPSVQFEGYDPKTIAYDFLVGSLMAGIPGAVETGRNIGIETSQAYQDGKAYADQTLINKALVQGRKAVEGVKQNPTNAEILGQQLQAQQEKGLSVLPGQMRQLENEVYRETLRNAQAYEEKYRDIYSQAEENNTITPTTGTNTEYNEVTKRGEALEERAIDNARQVMGEEASDESVEAVGRVVAGTASVEDHDTILSDPKAKEAVEQMVGEKLSAKNTEARETLENITLSRNIANADTLRKEVQESKAKDIAKELGQMNRRGGELFKEHYAEAVKKIGSGDAYLSIFSRLFSDGTVKGADFADSYDRIVAPFGDEVKSVFTEDFARQIFNEGRAKLEGNLAKSVAKSKAISAERAGTVTYQGNTKSMLSPKQSRFFEKFAKRANVGIEFYDGRDEGFSDDENGYYQDGVIHINVNRQNKLITIAKHELTHHIKATSPELYQKLEDYVFEKWYHNDRKAMEDAIEAKQRAYGNIDAIIAREEIIADASEAFFTDEGEINSVIKYSKKLGIAIHDGIKTMLDTFLDIQDIDANEEGLNQYRGYGDFLKDLKILKDAERMWLEALNESVERTRGNATETAQATETEARESRKEGLVIEDGNARWTDDRIKYLMDEFGATHNTDYSKAYAVLMNPRDFLKLTLSDERLEQWNETESKLDKDALKKEHQTPFLQIWSKDGTMVQGHEGRHRMRALVEAGVKSVPVVIRDTDTTYTKKPLPSMTLSSQDFGYDPVNNNAKVTVKDLVPIRGDNFDELKAKFGGEAEVRFSKKDDQAYLDAVNRGDMETARKMVDEYAKKSGYDSPKLYHGTPHFGFTQFKDNAHEVPFIYTSTNRTVSAHYAGDNNYAFPRPIGKAYKQGTSIADIIDNAKTIYDTEYKVMSQSQKRSRYNDVRNQAIEVANKLDDFYVNGSWDYETDNAIARVADLFFTIRDGEGEYDFSNYAQNDSLKNRLKNMVNAYKDGREVVKQYYDENRGDLSSGEKKYLSYLLGYDLGDVAIDIEYGMLRLMSSEDLLISNLGNVSVPSELKDAMDQIHEIGAYELFGNVGDNPFEFDANGGQFWALKVPQMGDGYYDTDSVSKWALENGYTSVIMHNIYDYGDKADNYVFFNSSQLKSADPVTYDDEGEVIPLSERFNQAKDDIRWSQKTENEPLPKATTFTKKMKAYLKTLGADKLSKYGLKAPVQISVKDLRTLWYDMYGKEEGERLNGVLAEVSKQLGKLAGKYQYVSLADALEGTIHYRVDENGKPTSVVLSCKVKNAEYDINFDFTTICAKRAPLQKVLERFIKTEGKKNGESLYDELRLDEEGLYTLRSIMEQAGFDVSCIGCFVEQNRYAQQMQSKTVADDWNKAIDEYAKKNGIEITDTFDFQNLDIDKLPYSEIQQGFRRYSALMKDKEKSVENKNRALIEAIPYLRKRLNPSDYASIAGQRAMMAMGNGKTNYYNLLKRGQGDSKQSTPFTPYNGEVALLPDTKQGKSLAKYLMSIGGARAQSASDFQIEYIFDYMQLIGDLAGRELPMHMYTKVIECAELLGMCGIKINLSAMCDVDDTLDPEYAGLKKKGKGYAYNISDQSVDYDKAVNLQRKPGYSKNVGIIMVVLSKQHMLQALSDPDVRYIIGYHSSKMPAIVAKASNMGKATDYTKLNKTNKLNDRGRALFDKAMRQATGETELDRYKDALRIFDDLIQEDKANDAHVRRGNEYTRYMTSYKGNTADFNVYDDLGRTKDARTTADNYIRYCMQNDLVPMYFPFAFHENYYKCEVYDYNVYDNVDGSHAPMEAVQNIYPDLDIANGETDTKKFMARVNRILKAQNEKNKALEPMYEEVERQAINNLSIDVTGNDYMDMNASGIDQSELEHRVDMTEENLEERKASLKEKELESKPLEYQNTIKKLEKNVESLKAEFKRTNKHPNPVETKKQAGKLIQRHGSNMSVLQEVTDTLTNIYEAYAKDGAEAFREITEMAEKTAVDIVNNISEVHFEGQDEYKQIRDYLKGNKITVTEEMKRNIPDFNDFRKKYFGKLNLVNGETGNIDSVYQELNEMFPTQFTDDYVNPVDQLNHIADVLDDYAPFYETLDGTSEEMQDYVVSVATDLIDTALDLQNKKTFADKKYEEKVKAIKKEREKALAKKKEALAELRDKYELRMAEAIDEAQKETKAELLEKSDRKRRLAQIAKIHARLAEKLLTPSDTKHLPDGYNKIVADVLSMFDFTTKRQEKWAEKWGEPSKRMKALLALRKALQDYATAYETGDSSNVDLGMEVDTDLLDLVDELVSAVGENTKLSKLDSATLEDVAVLFRAFEKQLNSYNKAFTEGRMETIAQSADKVVSEAKEQKNGKWRTGIMGRVFTQNITPSDFFTMMGGEIEQLYKNVRKGFDVYEKHLNTAKEFIQDRVNVKTAEKWMNHKETYTTTDGEKITLTDTQLMSLYCLMKREQAQGHIFGQGIVSAPVKVKKGLTAKTLDKTRVLPTQEDVTKWLSTLSDDQIEFADAVQKFFVDEISKWGNETSLNLYGYKKFTEKNYFPIQSSNDFLNSNFDAKGSDPTLKNISPTKALVKGANNPIMVDDIFSVFAKHTAQMASYNAYVPSITDFQRVWNHKIESPSGRKTAVKEVFNNTYGDGITKYVEHFFQDLNGVYKKNLDISTPEKLFGAFKKSAVGGNLRVLAQQPMAIARAGLIINPVYLTASVPKTTAQARKTYQEMLEHCPIAQWKTWGFYSMDITGASRDLKNVMIGKDSLSDKVFMNMYGVADNITWTCIFNACKMQVEAQNEGIEKGSQEYWDKVNDLASEVFDRTQVVDSPFHRSELMKSQDIGKKYATMFMAEPTKTINMINTELTMCARAISEGHYGKATAILTRLTATTLANAMLLAVGQSIIDAMRSAGGGSDDDDKGDFWERFKKHWITNTKDNLNVANMLPFVKDVQSLIDGYGVTRPDMMGVEKCVKAVQRLKKYYENPEGSTYTEEEVLTNTALTMMYVLGIPLTNAKRDIESLALTGAEYVDNPDVFLWYMEHKYQVNKNTRYIWADAYYDALDKGNKATAKKIYNYMISQGVETKYIQNREKTWRKHRYGEDSNGTDSEE